MSQHPRPTGRRSIVRGNRVAVALLLSLLRPGVEAGAQPNVARPPSAIYPETSSAAESLLKTAASHVREGQWDSAVELYQRAISQFPEALTALGPDEASDAAGADPDETLEVFVNVSDYAQRRMAQLPPEALRTYRDRVDDQARLLFEQGRDGLDPGPLRRVVEAYFCSGWGDDAAELLADLAFQEGRFDEAAGLYRRLLPPSDDAPLAWIYPDPSVDVARVAAKAILCDEAAGLGDGPGAVRRYAESYPGAEGQLAGREGTYAEILALAMREDALRASEGLDSRWPTFAGDPTRTKVLPEPVDPGELVWSIPFRASFDTSSNLNASPPRFGLDPGTPQDDSPSFFPVLYGDELLLTDGNEIQSYALEGSPDGRPVPPPAWRANIPPGSPSAARPTFGVERHTLTVYGDRVYARLGPSGAEFQMRNNVSAPATAIVAIDRRRPETPAWIRTADEVIAPPEQPNAAVLRGQVAFGGAPLADDQGVYVAMLKPGTQTLTWVACLDPASGRTKWVRFICSGTSPGFTRGMGVRNRGMIVNPELGHRLLSIGGSTLYYQTDLGALASIDARSGRINWLSSYPRLLDAPRGGMEAVNHNPAVVHEDLVIISPEDSDRLFAFDRDTGRLAWQVDPGGRVSHLLGVADGKVVATGNHVWTIDARSGTLRSRWPDGQTLLEGYGRGLLADGEIYWPTRDRLFMLDQQTGRPTDRPPIELRAVFGCGGGNLVAGDGYLVIAEKEHLRVFCKPSRMIRYYEDRIAADPDDASNYFRLARTASALGDDLLALESLDRSIERAVPGDRIDGRRLAEAAGAQRYEILMRLADRRLQSGDASGAIDRFEQASGSAPGLRERLSARLALADATAASGDHPGAVDVLQGLLDRPEVREIDLPADGGRSLHAELVIVDRLRELIRASGSEVYARHEEAAAELLRRGLDARDSRLLAEVSRIYPVSASAPEALAAIGELEEGDENWDQAAGAYHRLVVSPGEDRHRAIGLLGLARCYQAMALAPEAREAYGLAASRYGALEIELAGRVRRVDSFVSERIETGPDGGDRAVPPLRVAGRRDWPRDFEPLAIAASGGRPGPDGDRPDLLIGGLKLRAVEEGSGRVAWEITLGERPEWSAVVGGRLVVASSGRIVGIDHGDGTVLWEVTPGEGELAFGPVDPTPGGKLAPRAGHSGASLGEFRAYGDRIYFLRGDRDLVCLDPISGRPQWTYRASSVSIDPHLGLGLARVVIQLRMPNAVAVLDARDGRTLGQFPRDDSTAPWRRDPFPVALDRVALVPDGDSVELLDLDTGRTVWESSEESVLPSSPRPSPADPMVLGDAERLLVVRGEVIQRLEPTTGEVLWSTPLGRTRPDRRAEATALGHEALFSIGAMGSGLSVSAIAMGGGERTWTVDLPGDVNETWGIGLTADCVLAYRLDDGTPGSGPDEPVVLNLLRRDDGRRVQRLVVDAVGPTRLVGIDPRGVVVTGSGGVRQLSSPELAGIPGAGGR
ncbi:outer membrane protein assembly factor BamB family protein [Tautonia plasticadhaerens]|uniref:Outer membrane protein assembly factor BamB n=1 Tax=Tautonia plasticadhaerens TaxID=2527974 RepID=A0A518GYD2_9BACT|nr:PQQ-binding-like beta-propeller repeat protein [Tautonia plasticadhaerens]QDV33606.1 Outer membrane protein assembly factor BamB [Tautonia plasticadhaerens]